MNCVDSTKYSWNPCGFLTQKHVHKQYALLILNRAIRDFSCGPEFLINLWQNARVKMTVDGGTDRWLSWLTKHNINLNTVDPPHMVTGDFDSISSSSKEYFSRLSPTAIIMTEDQNETDYTKALRELAKYCDKESLQLDTVIVLCETSGRVDQILGNIHTMFKVPAILPNTDVFQLTSDSISWLLRKGQHKIEIPKKLREYKEWCSLVPIGHPTLVSTTGLKWNLDKRILEFGQLISTSNTYNGEELVTVKSDNTVLWSMGIVNLQYQV